MTDVEPNVADLIDRSEDSLGGTPGVPENGGRMTHLGGRLEDRCPAPGHA